MKKIIPILIFLLLTSCATTEVNPKVKNTVIVSVSMYCGVFSNFHRIAMRFVQLIDPEWDTICDNEALNNPSPSDPVPPI